MYNCLGATLVKVTRSRLTPEGPGQAHVFGQGRAIKVVKAIARRSEGRTDVSEGWNPAGSRSFAVQPTVASAAKLAIMRGHRQDGRASGSPDITTAAMRMRRGYVPENTNSSPTLTPTANLFTSGADFSVEVAGGGKGLGAIALDPLRPMKGQTNGWLRSRIFSRRMYGGAPMPGLGGSMDTLIALGAGYASGGAQGALSSYTTQKAADEQAKAAKRAAAAEAAAARREARAAEQRAFAMTEGQQRMRNILLFGGLGALVLGAGFYFLKRKK